MIDYKRYRNFEHFAEQIDSLEGAELPPSPSFSREEATLLRQKAERALATSPIIAPLARMHASDIINGQGATSEGQSGYIKFYKERFFEPIVVFKKVERQFEIFNDNLGRDHLSREEDAIARKTNLYETSSNLSHAKIHAQSIIAEDPMIAYGFKENRRVQAYNNIDGLCREFEVRTASVTPSPRTLPSNSSSGSLQSRADSPAAIIDQGYRSKQPAIPGIRYSSSLSSLKQFFCRTDL